VARHRTVLALVVAAFTVACAPTGTEPLADPLPAATPAEVEALLATSDRPVVLNVWASWCTPCRSEAPLLRAAHRQHGDRVTFLGVAVQDTQDGARRFLAEFDLDGFAHLFDAAGAVSAALGGRGVPVTFFYRPGGDLVRIHSGVIDERTLALLIDEIGR
jgi:cytochrome c biogenesis protein CcmG, thiol:disulfide interchange protein DsbE